MADERQKINGAIEYLRRRGYAYNDTAQARIEECDAWYTNQADDFHTRKNLNGAEVHLASLNFAKRCCGDDANLCEVVEINAGDGAQFEGVIEILKANRFDAMYRQQLERMSATGTVGAYIRVAGADLLENGRIRGGEIRICYVNAVGIVPLTVENNDVIDCAFLGYNLRAGKTEQTLVIFQKDTESGLYSAETFVFDDTGKLISEQALQLGDVKPFSIMRTAEVNNLDDMEGYGYPKLYGAIPVLKALDLCWAVLYGDLSKGEKLLFINELLAEVKRDADGKPRLSAQQKELFVLLGEKLPDQDSLIKEYNPEIRAEQLNAAIELCLSLLSMIFGYGTKKYTFDYGTSGAGKIKTATEYVGERQDAMQELNKQRFEARQYITDIVRAIIWFSNTFEGTAWPEDVDVCIEFDDSYVVDTQSQLDGLRADALSFPDVPEFLIQYIMRRLNCEREEAVGYIQSAAPEVDETLD